MENVFYNSYRDQVIGLPILGNRDNIMSITR